MTALVLALALSTAHATDLVGANSPPEELFLRASVAYDQGDPERAAALYDTLIDRGHGTGEVWYNAGNARLRAGRLGEAIAAWRHAQVLLPRNADVAANLAFARSHAKDAVAPPEPSALARTLLFWHHLLSPAERAWALLATSAATWLLLAARIGLRRWRPQRGLIAAAAVPALLFGVSIAVSTVDPIPLAVVTAPEVEVRAGTSHDAVVRFTLHEGTEAVVQDTLDGWVRILLMDDKDGWVPEDAVVIATLP